MGKGARACRMPGSFGTHKKFVQKKKVNNSNRFCSDFELEPTYTTYCPHF